MNGLFNSLSSKLAIQLVKTFLPYVVQRMEQFLEISSEKMRYEEIDEVCETNQDGLNLEQRTKIREGIEYLKKRKIPQTEWVFHLDNPEVWDWDNSLRATEPFGPLNVGTNAVLSAAVVKIPLWIKHEHLNVYKELRWNFKMMRIAEEFAMKFIRDLDMACAQNDDFLYMIYLLKAIEEKKQIKKCYGKPTEL